MTPRLLLYSDAHGIWPNPDGLPQADYFIFCGDATDMGLYSTWAEKLYSTRTEKGVVQARLFFERNELARAQAFFEQVAKRYKLLWVPGNHDWYLGPEHFAGKCIEDTTWVDPDNGLRFHGVSLTTAYNAPELTRFWCRMTTDPEAEKAVWNFEPVDVVVSHGPPLGLGDRLADGTPVGSEQALAYIRRHQPRLFACGHIHEAFGTEYEGQTMVVNTAGRLTMVQLEL